MISLCFVSLNVIPFFSPSSSLYIIFQRLTFRMTKQIKSSSSVLIREIRVSYVSLDCSPKKKKKKISQPRTEVADDDRWKVQYTVFLDCPSPNRIKVTSVNEVWQSDDPGRVMMERARSIINEKAMEYSINCDSDMAKYYLMNSSPWEYLWAKAENDMMTQKQESLKKASSAVKGHIGIKATIKSSGWVKGEEFKHRNMKYYAKTAVLEQLEKSTNMEITKAESVLSSVVTDLQQ